MKQTRTPAPLRDQDREAGIAALIKDLKARGLFEDTLIVWGGEFGRAPTSEGAKRDYLRTNPSSFIVAQGSCGIRC